jgi:hypothetical protein
VFTVPDFGVHDAPKRLFTLPDPGVHDAPKRLFTMGRFGCSRWGDVRSCIGTATRSREMLMLFASRGTSNVAAARTPSRASVRDGSRCARGRGNEVSA